MTEVKFSMSVPAFDALRRICKRDFDNDRAENARLLRLPEAERTEGLYELMRNENDRGMVERTLGFDSSTNERGDRK